MLIHNMLLLFYSNLHFIAKIFLFMFLETFFNHLHCFVETTERGYLKRSSKFRITELQKTTLLRRKHAGNTIFKTTLYVLIYTRYLQEWSKRKFWDLNNLLLLVPNNKSNEAIHYCFQLWITFLNSICWISIS